jgi:hypothetical protein
MTVKEINKYKIYTIASDADVKVVNGREDDAVESSDDVADDGETPFM